MTFRTRILLADGRELFYYGADSYGADRGDADGSQRLGRQAADRRRDLTAAATTSEIRWNPLFRDYSVIADHRQGRTYKPPADLCPLDPSRDGRQTEIPAADYEVAVFENRFPSFSDTALDGGSSFDADSALNAGSGLNADYSVDAAWAWDAVPLNGVPPFRSGPGAGRCEVVCFTSEHGTSFSGLSPARARTVIDAWADRTEELGRMPSVHYVFCFENRGEEIGVTLSHPHGQIYGYPFVPPRFVRIGESLVRHRERSGGCLQCELLEAECRAEERIVVSTDHWVAYVPFAARWPYEVRIVPRTHVPDLPALDDARRSDLAAVYLDVLGRFDRLFDGPVPYIAGWQQAPSRRHRTEWHLAAEIFTIRRAAGKLKYLAGSESAAGVWINDVRPEEAASRLRSAGRDSG